MKSVKEKAVNEIMKMMKTCFFHGLFIGFYRFFGLVVARLHSSSRFQALPP
jgi:hypothetical protein